MLAEKSPKVQDHSLFSADGLTFRDVLDMINPLQHLPVVSNIYRAITEDELSAGSRLVGGYLAALLDWALPCSLAMTARAKTRLGLW